MAASFFDLDFPVLESADAEARRLGSFQLSLGSLRKCKFCYFVAQKVVSAMERWCGKDDEKLNKMLGTSMEELSDLLRMAEDSEQKEMRRI